MATIETLPKKLNAHRRDCEGRIGEIGRLVAKHKLAIERLNQELMKEHDEVSALAKEELDLHTEIDLAKRIRRELDSTYCWDCCSAESNADMDYLSAEERQQVEFQFLQALGLDMLEGA
jgi:hypothetical protein